MDRFLNTLKQAGAAQVAGQAQPRFGIVASVDPVTHTARVTLQPEGVLSGWLPILTQWVGAGWGLCAPPSPGDQVLVLPQEGDAEHGVVVGRCWSDQAAPPPANPGEFWLVHQTGSFLKLLNDGSVSGQASVWNLVGDLHVQGDVYDSQGSLNRLRQHYDQHTHIDSRGGRTSSPSPQD